MGVNVGNLRRAVPLEARNQKIGGALFLALVAAACIAPKFIGLTTQSLWLDELNVLRYVSFPHLDQTFFQAIRDEPHPPLWLVMMWGYAKLFGLTPFALRLSGALTATLAVAACYFTAAPVLGKRVALIAAMLLGMSSIGLYEAQEVRPYSLVFLFAAISAAWFADIASTPEPSRKQLVRLVTVNTLLCLTHYSGVFLMLGEAAILLALHMRRGHPARGLITAAVVSAASLPALAWMAWTLQVYDPMATANIHWWAGDLLSPLRAFFGQFAILILVAAPFVLARARVRKLFDDPAVIALIGAIALVFAAVTAAAFVHPSWMQNKNFYVAFPAGYLLLAVLLCKNEVVHTPVALPMIFLVCAAGLATYLATGYPLHASTYYAPFREQVREASDLIGTLAEPQDTVLVAKIDINGNHLFLVPTQMYAERVTGKLWRSKDIRLLPPPRETAGRLYALKAALAEIKPHGTLIIDLPQSTRLSMAEDHLLDGATCVTKHVLVHHIVVQAGFGPDRCPKRQTVTDGGR
jgi:hypothetical protein